MIDFNDYYVDMLNKRFGKIKMMPLFSWDVFAMSATKACDLSVYDKIVLHNMAKENNWKNSPNFNHVFMDQDNVVVVTDLYERIIWASSGFKKMTGYERNEAMGLRPVQFLQGQMTNPETKRLIRKKISNREPGEFTLVNYRKNGEPYHCYIKIEPIYNADHQLVNFLAIEKDMGVVAA